MRLTRVGWCFCLSQNLDDCWAKSRDADGRIVPDPVAFPEGMKALADYVHGRGLQFGIYSGKWVYHRCGAQSI